MMWIASIVWVGLAILLSIEGRGKKIDPREPFNHPTAFDD